MVAISAVRRKKFYIVVRNKFLYLIVVSAALVATLNLQLHLQVYLSNSSDNLDINPNVNSAVLDDSQHSPIPDPLQGYQEQKVHRNRNISAIIPFCYNNRLHQLQDAVESALNQTYPTYEVIIAIDSEESCVKEINNVWAQRGEDRVKIVKVPPCQSQKEKCGTVGRTRNVAISFASPFSTHYAMLDDDDLWMPYKNQVQMENMIQGNYSISSSDAFSPKDRIRARCRGKNSTYSSIDLNDVSVSAFDIHNGGKYRRKILRKLGLQKDDEFPSHVTHDILRKHNIFINSATIISKDAFSGFRNWSGTGSNEDHMLWLSILSKFPAAYFSSNPLVVYDNSRCTCDDPSTSPLFL